MPDSTRIWRAAEDDVDLVASLFDAYRQFYKQAPGTALARRFIAERLARGDSVIFVAESGGGKPLGFVQLYPSFSSVHAFPIWILNDLFVALECRGRGIGRALMGRAREHAIETGAKQLVLETASDNPAQKLYESLGYVCQNDTSRFYALSLD